MPSYFLKWVIIAASLFAIIMSLYEFVIRRFDVMRFLFGMQPLPRAAIFVAVPEQS